MIPFRGAQLAVTPYRMQSEGGTPATTGTTSPAPAPSGTSMPPAPVSKGRISNAVEFAIARVDDVVNYARKVRFSFEFHNLLTQLRQV